MALEDERELRSCSLPLQSAMALAVNDILACSVHGSTRRAYMRAKSIELLTTVIHARLHPQVWRAAAGLQRRQRLGASDAHACERAC